MSHSGYEYIHYIKFEYLKSLKKTEDNIRMGRFVGNYLNKIDDPIPVYHIFLKKIITIILKQRSF